MNANVERAGTVRFVVEVNDALYDWLVQIPGWVSMTGGPPPNRRVTVEDLIDDGVLGEASSNLDERSTELSLEERKAIQAAWHVETHRLA